ncbi:MAG: transporter substrate-binding domain-containing protein [Spirochaetes bacterium]|nr:transporter substrate-binding domain-containing protein [Spirochaetota bacterium]
MKAAKAILIASIMLAVLPVYGQNLIRLNTHIQAPLTFLGEYDQPEGTAMQPVLHALKEMGWQAKISFLPWARAQLMVENNEADGFFAASRNADRDRYAVRSLPIATQTINWYLPADSRFDPAASDFPKQARFGGYIGANMLSWLLDNGYNVSAQPTHPDQLFLMLLYGRIDACLANNNNYENFISAYPQYEGLFRIVNQSSNELYIYFSHNFIDQNPDFLDTFNRNIARYRQGQ